MTNEPPYVSDLFGALEDLIDKVHEHVPDVPTSVELSLAFGAYALARARIERKKYDITN